MERVSQSQIYMLFSLFLFTTTLGFFTNTLTRNAHFMSWLSLIIGAAVGLMITYLSYRLAIRRPTQFLGNYGKDILGWLHYPLMGTMIICFIVSASTVTRQLQDYIVVVYLPGTPEWAVSALFGICLAYSVRSGVGTIFRCSQGIFFLSIIGVLIVPFFVHHEIMSPMAIALVNHLDWKGVWNGAYLITALFAEMAYIPFLFPFFTSSNKTMKSLGLATATSVFIVLSNLIPIILVFGPHLASNLPYPQLELIRNIQAGSALESLDPLLFSVWLASLFIKASLFIYLAIISLTQTLSLKDHKPFSFSMTAMVVGCAIYMVRSKTELDELFGNGEFAFLLISELIPVVYLIVDWIRSSKLKQEKTS
ncbi:GerAB/ArcD/ProY family transporter [Paenibacillus sp. Soil750]|uniref:GerAB/ArcD/ProY family transporter n=1 Tax=Paenibacillus sp. Soil750 TaxID=1736398 RepID=UPI0006FF2A01|nr:endospore germination permease [Paenibacillus sp. Soil750]KRE70915.1 hypothetical protein ASL11_11535 [Paenibacillus sp. Soil750]